MTREICEAEWQHWRHHERLAWSRFQTIALIEGACLAGLYALDLDSKRCLIFAVFASLLVLVLSLLALGDQRRAKAHLERATRSDEGARPPLSTRGAALLTAAIVLINVWNVLVIADQVYYVMEDVVDAAGETT
jgi:hypothetical protein